MQPPPEPAWTAGQVASELGISESTLRTWHRRYGLSPPGAQPGRYRRYQAQDIARLRRMLELVKAGMLASEAARVVRGERASPPPAAPAARDQASLIEAARAVDTARCDRLLDALLARHGVVDAWELVCCPALLSVDSFPRDEPALIAAEHVLSWALIGALHRLPHPPAAPGAPLTVLACTAGEQHTLPLAVLAAALAALGRPSRMLGAATPARSIEQAVREARPAAVVLWAQRADTAAVGALRALSRFPVRLVAAGPGWDDRRLSGARLVTSLRGALELLASDPGP